MLISGIDDECRRNRAQTDTILSTPDYKPKRLELLRYLASRRHLMLALTSKINFFGRIARCLPNLFILRNAFSLCRRDRKERGKQDNELSEESLVFEESQSSVLYNDDGGEHESREERFLPRPRPEKMEVIMPSKPQLGVFGLNEGYGREDFSLMFEETFQTLQPCNQSMKHVRRQSMQQYPSVPMRVHQRNHSMTHVRSMSLPLLAEKQSLDGDTCLDTLFCGGQILHAKYRDSHEPRPFSMAPPSPELLGKRKKRQQRPKSFDTGYDNTTQYRSGPVRKARTQFLSLENPSCQEYLEEKFRRQSILLEEIRSKMPKTPQAIFKKDPELQRSSGLLT